MSEAKVFPFTKVWRLLELGKGGSGDAIIDFPAPDGTTAMAMAIGHLNAEIAALLLTSEFIEPKKDIWFMAEEVMRTHSNGDTEMMQDFKSSLCHLLGDPQINPGLNCLRNVMDLEMLELSKRFPFINDDAEMQRAANKSTLDKMLR